MKTHELFEVKEGLEEIVQKAIEQAVQHPDVINWDQLYDPYDSYEQALVNTTIDILDEAHLGSMEHFAHFIGPGEYPKVLEFVHKLARRKAVGQKRRSAQFEQTIADDREERELMTVKPWLAVYVELSGIRRKEAKPVLFQLGADVREIIQHPDHVAAFLQFDTQSDVDQGVKKLRRLSRGKPKFKIEHVDIG